LLRFGDSILLAGRRGRTRNPADEERS